MIRNVKLMTLYCWTVPRSTQHCCLRFVPNITSLELILGSVIYLVLYYISVCYVICHTDKYHIFYQNGFIDWTDTRHAKKYTRGSCCLVFCFSFLPANFTHLLQNYRKVSNIRRTKSQNWNDSHLVLKSSLPNPLKPGVKSRMKM